MKKYKIVYADPAWQYRDSRKNKPAYGGITYPTMKTDDIAALPVQNIADKDCVLFLWATMPMLPDALKVMKAWGFKYKTCAFNWVKTNPRSGTYAVMLGQWTMGSTEICLLGVKGHPKRICKNIKQLVVEPKTGHSKKPGEVRDRIVALMGELPRVELFARDCAPGWDCIGNDIDGRDIREVLACTE